MIEIDVDTSKVDRALNELQKRVKNLHPVLDEIGAHIVSEIDLNFRDASDPYGNEWAPLKHRNGVPLNDTGRLKGSITHNVNGNAVEIGPDDVDYAPTHQFGAKKGAYGTTSRGGPIPWGDVPARPFLPTEQGGLPQEWEQDIIEIISDYLDNI